MKAFRKHGGDTDTVAVIFASVEEMKKLPALQLHGRRSTFKNVDHYDSGKMFIFEGVARGVLFKDVVKAIVEMEIALDGPDLNLEIWIWT